MFPHQGGLEQLTVMATIGGANEELGCTEKSSIFGRTLHAYITKTKNATQVGKYSSDNST
jgi:hypothetical protein